MTSKIPATIVFLSSLFIGYYGYSQEPCDKNLTPSRNKNLPAYEPRGNRCEGFYDSDIADISLELVNLTCGNFKYSLSSDETLEVIPIAQIGEKTHIQSSALQLRKYYRMDAEIQSDSKLDWPVSEVLKPANLSYKKIGICGWLVYDYKTRDEIPLRMYIPLKVNSSTQKTDDCNILRLVFMSNTDHDLFLYRAGKIDDEDSNIEFQELNDKIYYAGKPIEIYLDVGSFEEDIAFYISGRVYNNGTLTDEWSEYFFGIASPNK